MPNVRQARRYRQILVVALAGQVSWLATSAAIAKSGPSLEGRVAALERVVASQQEQLQSQSKDVRELKDIKAIEDLQITYGYYTDKMLWNQVGSLFSANATLEIAQRGIYVGHASIVRMYKSFIGQDSEGLKHGQLFNHIMQVGVIHVAPDGQTAKGRWRATVQDAGLDPHAQDMISDGVYENEYVREDGVWKISKLKFWTTYYTPYKDGWTGGKQLWETNGVSKSPDADLPSTDHAGVFPDVYFPPFHYPNPVTGNPVDVTTLNRDAVRQNVGPDGSGRIPSK